MGPLTKVRFFFFSLCMYVARVRCGPKIDPLSRLTFWFFNLYGKLCVDSTTSVAPCLVGLLCVHCQHYFSFSKKKSKL
jgi:hypothetical protein